MEEGPKLGTRAPPEAGKGQQGILAWGLWEDPALQTHCRVHPPAHPPSGITSALGLYVCAHLSQQLLDAQTDGPLSLHSLLLGWEVQGEEDGSILQREDCSRPPQWCEAVSYPSTHAAELSSCWKGSGSTFMNKELGRTALGGRRGKEGGPCLLRTSGLVLQLMWASPRLGQGVMPQASGCLVGRTAHWVGVASASGTCSDHISRLFRKPGLDICGVSGDAPARVLAWLAPGSKPTSPLLASPSRTSVSLPLLASVPPEPQPPRSLQWSTSVGSGSMPFSSSGGRSLTLPDGWGGICTV